MLSNEKKGRCSEDKDEVKYKCKDATKYMAEKYNIKKPIKINGVHSVR